MKAIVIRDYGPPDTLRLVEIGKPEPADDEVLVKVHAASVNALDWRLARGEPYVIRIATGVWRPKSKGVGVDLAGRVEAVGRLVTRFRPGDEVFGARERGGAFAEYACAHDNELAPRPQRLTFEQAAAIPVAGLTALQGLRRDGRIEAGQKVLIHGAAGGVGTFAVQIAKALGAHVTGVCSTRNVEVVRSLGADAVIDYTREDFTRGAHRYDLVLDVAGTRPLSAIRRVMQPKGTYVVVGGPGGRWIGPLGSLGKAVLSSPFSSRRLVATMSKGSKDDLLALKDLVDSGKVTPVIDRRYALAEVPEAIRYVEQGHPGGKVVIAIA